MHGCLKVFVVFLAMTFLLGCTEEDPIVTYTVPKHELIQIPIETPKEKKGSPSQQQRPPSAEPVPTRMLAAQILDKEVAWFFKGQAPIEAFSDDAAERFDELIKSTKLEDPSNPTWELGEAWQQFPPSSSMRHADLKLGNVVFSVIKLTLPDSDRQKYTLDNVNRWRDQLGLAKLGIDEVESNARKLMTADQHEATLVDIEGMPSKTGMGPMAGGTAPRRRVAPKREPMEKADSEEKPQFTGTPAESWSPQKLRTFQRASYEAKVGDDAANISVSKAGGDLLANINRWRGQIGLEGYPNKTDIESEEVIVGDKSGLLSEMHGPDGESIVAVVVPEGERAWFFKLMGKTPAVENQTEAFKEYLDTIKFE